MIHISYSDRMKMKTVFKYSFNGIIFLSILLSFNFVLNLLLVILLSWACLYDGLVAVLLILLVFFIINPLQCVISVSGLFIFFHSTVDECFLTIFYYLRNNVLSLICILLFLFVISPVSFVLYYFLYNINEFIEEFSLPGLLIFVYSLTSSLATPFIIFFAGWVIYDNVVKKIFKNRDIFPKLQNRNKDIREKVLYELRKQNETNNKLVE